MGIELSVLLHQAFRILSYPLIGPAVIDLLWRWLADFVLECDLAGVEMSCRFS
jgi:hypothetical protein